MNRYVVLLALVLSLAGSVVAQGPSGSTAGQSPMAPNAQAAPADANATAPVNPNDTLLQSQIENALRNQPALNASHIVVNVSDDSINLSGTVGSGKDKQAAERIAQSFDGNRKMNDALMVTGQNPANPPASPSANNQPPAAPQC
jgi:hypothetical protein